MESPTECANFSAKKELKVDALILLRIFGTYIFKPRLMKFFLAINISGYFVTVGLHLYFFIYEFTFVEMINYCPVLSILLYAINSQFTLIVKGKALEATPELYLWSWDSAGEEVHSKIRRQASNVVRYCLATVFSTVVLLALSAIPDEKDSSFIVHLLMAQIYYPKYYNYVDFFIKLASVPMIYSLIVHALELAYINYHINFQLELLVQHLNKLDGGVNIDKKLKFCVKRHLEISRAVNRTNEIMGFSLLVFSYCGLLIGMSVILFAVEGTAKAGCWRYMLMISAGVTFFLGFGLIIHAGQILETKAQELGLALLSNKWYNWDNVNKLKLLIVLPNVKVLQSAYLKYFCINHEWGIAIVRGAYSIVSFMITLKHKRK